MTDWEVVISARCERLERKCRIAFAAAILSSIFGISSMVGATGSRAIVASDAKLGSQVLNTLQVHELNVVDKSGITRVKIAAPLPHAIIDGKQNATRGRRPEDTMSGVLLLDADGVERSGYATVDHGYSNVLLTLDDKHKQHATFIAEPTGATTLRLFNADTKDRVDVSVSDDGPLISMVRRGKEIYRFPTN